MKMLLRTISVAALLPVAACGRGGDRASQMTSYSASEDPKNNAELFTLPPEQMAHIGIYTVAKAPLVRVLRLTGTVAYNGFLTTPVITQIGGPVSRILAMPGQRVRAGQPLLYVTSPDYSQQRTTYLKAREAFTLADESFKRTQDLFAHGAASQADVDQAQSTRNQALADLQASEQSMRILGISNPEALVKNPPSPEIALDAPRSGEIVERLCSQGQVLQAGTTQCFTLSDMSSVWILVNVYQNDIAYVRPGDEVTISTDAYPTAVHGKIDYVAAALDPATRTLQARIVAPNPGERLKKDMYVTAEVRAGEIPDALQVPDAAVLRDAQNLPYVYVETGDRQFARRMVTVGDSQNGRTQILSGVQPGEKIVGDGSLFLQFQNTVQR